MGLWRHCLALRVKLASCGQTVWEQLRGINWRTETETLRTVGQFYRHLCDQWAGLYPYWPSLASHWHGNASPICLRPWRLPLAKWAAVEDKLKEMVEAGLIKPSDSPWSSLVVLVRKKNSSWRFWVDYNRLNNVTSKNSYPLPWIDEALDYRLTVVQLTQPL